MDGFRIAADSSRAEVSVAHDLSGLRGEETILTRVILTSDFTRVNEGKDRVRQSQEAAYRFMSIMGGDRPGFEEATRALFAAQRERFDQLIERWPGDVRDHARKLAAAALEPGAPDHHAPSQGSLLKS